MRSLLHPQPIYSYPIWTMHTVTYHLMEIHSKPTSHADDTNDTHRKRGVVWGVGQERLGPPYFFISLVLDPLNSLVWYVPSLRYTRGLGWRMHCGAEVTESSTNRQHHFISPSSKPELGPVVCKQFCISLDASRRLNKHITGASPPRLSIAPPRADRCWSPQSMRRRYLLRCLCARSTRFSAWIPSEALDSRTGKQLVQDAFVFKIHCEARSSWTG